LAITLPVCAFLLATWALHFRSKRPSALRNYGVPVATAVIVASSATPEPVLATGVILAALVVFSVVTHSREPIDASVLPPPE
jgi:hypothetical protein